MEKFQKFFSKLNKKEKREIKNYLNSNSNFDLKQKPSPLNPNDHPIKKKYQQIPGYIKREAIKNSIIHKNRTLAAIIIEKKY